MSDDLPDNPFDEAAARVVEIGNQLAELNPDADYWDIADGLLAGAVQYWLYTRQPCDDPECQDCAAMATAELRLKALLRSVDELARSSEYFHTANDFGAGRA